MHRAAEVVTRRVPGAHERREARLLFCGDGLPVANRFSRRSVVQNPLELRPHGTIEAKDLDGAIRGVGQRNFDPPHLELTLTRIGCASMAAFILSSMEILKACGSCGSE